MRAAEAIKRAVNGLDAPEDRLIGHALLGMNEFGHKSVEERQLILARSHGISVDTYKRRRPVVLGEIIKSLQTQPHQTRVPPYASMPVTLPPIARDIPTHVVVAMRRLDAAMTEMYYAALACVFVSRTNAAIVQDGLELPSGAQLPLEASDISESLFIAIGDFELARLGLEKTFPTWKGSYIPYDQIVALWWILNTLDAIGPFVHTDRLYIGDYARRVRRGDSPDTDHTNTVRHLFESTWSPWFADNTPKRSDRIDSRLEALAAKTTTAQHMLRYWVGQLQTDDEFSLHKPLAAIVHYYEEPEMDCNGVPLEDAAVHYLASTTDVLVSSHLVWLDYEDATVGKHSWSHVRLTRPRHETR